MKTTFATIFVLVLSLGQALAQNKGNINIHLDFLYAEDLREEGFNLGVEYTFYDNISISPSWTTYLVRHNVTVNTLNIDARYYTPAKGKVQFYGLLGFGRTTITEDAEFFGIPLGTFESTENGLNIGFGGYLSLTEHFKLHSQIKYSSALLDDAIMQVGFAYSIR